jgi:pyochelin biosynthesis protein PchG
MKVPMKVVVCGTTFGRVHVAALGRCGPDLELAGILARGSARSVDLAERHRVPLYRDVGDLPADIDAACVAVRAGVVGGPGSTLAAALIDRGIHVLQEHPVHADELAGLLRAARRRGVVYRLNNHYLHVDAVRRFVAAARAQVRYGPPRYLDAATGVQVAYALVDILGRALPSLRPWAFAASPWPPELRRLTAQAPPLHPLYGVLGGVPLTLRVHNQLDPTDPDNHAHLLHRITIGTDTGNLTLLNTHGPVLWSPRMHVRAPDDPSLALPSTATIGDPDGPAFADVVNAAWPAAMAAALAGFGAAVREGEDPMRLGQYHLTTTRIWQQLTIELGQPDLIDAVAPAPVGVSDLTRGGEL